MDRPPILLDIPDEIVTERLIVRTPRPGDGPAFNAAVCDTLTELQAWLFLYPDGPPTVADSEVYVRQRHVSFLSRKHFPFLIQLRETDTIIGTSGLRPRDWRVPSFEIGYWLRTGYTGHGYITESVRAVTDFAFRVLSAQRVQIRCDPANARSAAVAQRAGYTLEGTLANAERNLAGTLVAEQIFARTQNYPTP